MNGTTFNANNLKELINELNFKKMGIADRLTAISSHCSWASSAYRSEDSALASSFDNIDATLQKASGKIETVMTELCEKIKLYVEETLALESGTEAKLSASNETLQSAISIIDNI